MPGEGGNELGELATWFNTFLGRLQDIVKSIAQHSGSVGQAAEHLTRIAGKMTAGAGETSQSAQSVSVATEEMSVNLRAVAAAMEQSTTNTTMVYGHLEGVCLLCKSVLKPIPPVIHATKFRNNRNIIPKFTLIVSRFYSTTGA